jgi:uncharacterized protein (DUF3820 family)
LRAPSVIDVIPFGKHHGRQPADLPKNYPFWLVTEFRSDGEVTTLVRIVLYTARLELRLRHAVEANRWRLWAAARQWIGCYNLLGPLIVIMN